jgi:hypothetical protein
VKWNGCQEESQESSEEGRKEGQEGREEEVVVRPGLVGLGLSLSPEASSWPHI